MDIRKIIVCPVCHGQLPLDDIVRNGNADCPSCLREFTYRDGVFDLTPASPPHEDVKEKWDLWEKLQANGLVAYKSAPEASCAVAGRPDVEAWRRFLRMGFRPRVLDIGCGPFCMPEYLRGWRFVHVVGIEPLQPGMIANEMPVIKGIGEYLPFRDSSFDRILLATSLDHTMSPKRVIAEVRRCLKPRGAALIWVGLPVPEPEPLPSLVDRAVDFARVRLHLLPPKRIRVGPASSGAWRKINDSLKVPEGAIDIYHFRHDDETDLRRWFSEIGLNVARRSVHASANLFLELRRCKPNEESA